MMVIDMAAPATGTLACQCPKVKANLKRMLKDGEGAILMMGRRRNKRDAQD